MEETTVRITAVRDVGPNAIAIDVETPPGFDAAPGQFVKFVISVDGEQQSRFYTISSPQVGETFELTVGIDPDGGVSPHLRDLGPDDEVVISGPYGNAYYEGEHSVCLIAGGPGVGPAVGIADPIHGDRLDRIERAGGFVRVLDSSDPLSAGVEAGLASMDEEDVGEMQVFVYGFADFLDDAMSAIAAAGGEPDRAKVENFG
ncbi:oxidoreductase [Halobacteriales archaeon QH_2_65_14]|nr:MAG: oxidoreductase [Halobacteriales archaeon QH_2_65_14]